MNQAKSVIILNISAFLTMLGIGMIMTLLPRRILDLSGSVAGTGFLAAAFALTFVLLQIPVGRMSDRFGVKIFLGAGYLICGASGILYLFADTTGTYLLGRMLQGLGEIPIWSLAPAILSIYHPLTKGRHIGIYNACIHAGLTLGSLSGILIQRICRENEVFLIFAVLSALSGILILMLIPGNTRESCIRTELPKLTTIAGLPGFFVIFCGICCYGAGYGIFISIIPAFLMDVKGAGSGFVGLFFVLFYIGVGLSQVLAGPFSDRYGRERAMILGLAAASLGLALFPRSGQHWLLPLLFVSAAGLGTFCVSAMAFLNDQVPKALNGTISGAFYFFWGIGYSSGPLILGMIGHQWGWTWGFSLTSGLFILQMATCLVLWGNKARADHCEKFKPTQS